jgi:glycosyltransferase involved in cell wall biosynthesis
MGQTPKVSVIIPVYNAEAYIAQAIESVFSQTFRNFEVLVVDDGSTDRSPDIVQELVERYAGKLKYFEHRNHINRGVSASRNVGISYATGEYVAFLDGDDLWLPEKLQQQAALLDAYPDVGTVYCAIAIIDEHGQPTTERYGTDVVGGSTSQHLREAFDIFFPISRVMWLGSTILTRKALLLQTHLFDEDLRHGEDALVSMKLAYLGAVYFLAEPLAKYRLHTRNASRKWVVKGQNEEVNRYVQTMNCLVMTRVSTWLAANFAEYERQDFRIKLANLVYQAYQNHMISRWGLYKLLVCLFPYRSMNVRLLKIFISLGLGYTLTHKIQALWKEHIHKSA